MLGSNTTKGYGIPEREKNYNKVEVEFGQVRGRICTPQRILRMKQTDNGAFDGCNKCFHLAYITSEAGLETLVMLIGYREFVVLTTVRTPYI